jgi:hypothetical protein
MIIGTLSVGTLITDNVSKLGFISNLTDISATLITLSIDSQGGASDAAEVTYETQVTDRPLAGTNVEAALDELTIRTNARVAAENVDFVTREMDRPLTATNVAAALDELTERGNATDDDLETTNENLTALNEQVVLVDERVDELAETVENIDISLIEAIKEAVTHYTTATYTDGTTPVGEAEDGTKYIVTGEFDAWYVGWNANGKIVQWTVLANHTPDSSQRKSLTTRDYVTDLTNLLEEAIDDEVEERELLSDSFTTAEWEALTPEQQETYDFKLITDDYPALPVIVIDDNSHTTSAAISGYETDIRLTTLKTNLIDSVVNDLVTGGTTVPLSAEQGKVLAAEIAEAKAGSQSRGAVYNAYVPELAWEITNATIADLGSGYKVGDSL